MLIFKKIVSFFIRFGISAILLFFLFKFQNIDIPVLLENIKHSDKILLALAFLAALSTYILCFYRWKMLLTALGIKPPLKKLIVSFSGGIFFNVFLPSTIGGDLVRSLDLAAHTQKPKEVIATVFLDRLSGYVGMVMVVLFSVLFGWGLIYDNQAVLLSIAVIVAVLVLVLLVLFNSFLFSKINGLLNSSRAGSLREALKNLHQELYYFKNHKKVLFKNLAISFLIQLISPVSYYIVALALGIHINIIYFFVFLPIVSAITLLPIAIGGLGLRENMFALFLGRVGVNNNFSVALSLLGFAFILICAAVGGLVYVFTVHYRRLQRHKASGVSG